MTLRQAQGGLGPAASSSCGPTTMTPPWAASSPAIPTRRWPRRPNHCTATSTAATTPSTLRQAQDRPHRSQRPMVVGRRGKESPAGVAAGGDRGLGRSASPGGKRRVGCARASARREMRPSAPFRCQVLGLRHRFPVLNAVWSFPGTWPIYPHRDGTLPKNFTAVHFFITNVINGRMTRILSELTKNHPRSASPKRLRWAMGYSDKLLVLSVLFQHCPNHQQTHAHCQQARRCCQRNNSSALRQEARYIYHRIAVYVTHRGHVPDLGA